ncbi:unnamed protein product [Notodromas monacha]|uniref:Uncharacterized protein n=1 Tax=Notodromas monacha TaxID=399045 RepID=A0A7R9C0B3_9CRUS|nr:unnamed protein product [Notodromas monacha]CAG0923413.1 unnamed protein product [Notodromas monacha]
MLRKTNLLKLVSTEDEDTFCALDTPPVAPPRSSRTPSPRTKPGNNPSPRAAGPHHHHHHPHQPDSGSPEDPTRRDSVASSAAASVQLGIDSRRSSGSNRTPTPTLVYQPSSVSDGGDDDDELLPTVMALTPTRIVFDDDNEVTF